MPGRTLPRALLAAALFLVPQAVPAQPVPALKARITDLTQTLSADQAAGLEARLAGLEARKGSQVAVLIVPTTQPETIEAYSIRVVEQWKLGRARVDDGVLLIVAKNDRKLRIEVGRGLEGAIPDAYAKRIIDEAITPRFKEGDFHAGIAAGLDRIAKLIDGEPMPAPQRRASSSSLSDYGSWMVYGFIAIMLIGGLLRSIFGRFLGSVVVAIAASVVAYVLIGALAAAIVAVVAFLLTLLNDGSGWSSGGGGWSSSGGSGYSGGGGFSGGGGSFGGGGASGSW
jgi:uncharacterized protein